jgi:hypothetical protein
MELATAAAPLIQAVLSPLYRNDTTARLRLAVCRLVLAAEECNMDLLERAAREAGQ